MRRNGELASIYLRSRITLEQFNYVELGVNRNRCQLELGFPYACDIAQGDGHTYYYIMVQTKGATFAEY